MYMCVHCVQVFCEDGGEVHGHWAAYTEQMDRMLEESLRLNVKWSLLELSRAINGDGKSTPNPLFKVKVVLNSKVGVLSTSYMYIRICVSVFLCMLQCNVNV